MMLLRYKEGPYFFALLMKARHESECNAMLHQYQLRRQALTAHSHHHPLPSPSSLACLVDEDSTGTLNELAVICQRATIVRHPSYCVAEHCHAVAC